MPAWAQDDPRTYWAAADEHERANGRLYREVQFALPRELSPAARRDLAGSFTEQLTSEERLPYTLAIHKGEAKRPGGEDNPHAHLMFSERANDGIERSADQWFKRHNAPALRVTRPARSGPAAGEGPDPPDTLRLHVPGQRKAQAGILFFDRIRYRPNR